MLTLTRPRQSNAIDHVNLARKRGRLLPARSAVYHQGDTVDGFFYVNSGVVMVFRLLEDSSRQISGFFTSGELFGMSSAETYSDNAVCVTTASVARLTLADVREDIDLQKMLYQTTCDQLDAAQRMITTLTKKSAGQKIAAFFVMLAKKQGCEGESFDVKLPMSRLDIADFLGMSIETVSRRVTALKDTGVVQVPNRRTITITSYNELCREAGALS
jgi:CRP-like cAMP-binding protein